jgi:hypothetical protein
MMTRHLAGRTLACLGLLWCTGMALAERITTGTLAYPIKDNIDLQEGTLECWVLLPVAMDTFDNTGQSSSSIAVLFSLIGNPGTLQASLLTGGIFGQNIGWYIRPGPKPLMQPTAGNITWQPNEWHHLAVVWKDKELTLYLDGKLASTRTNQASLKTVFERLDDQLLFGDKWHVGGRLVIDELRISLVARTPDELGFHHVPLQPDPFTALLDSFDLAEPPDEGPLLTKPEVILAGAGGTSRGPCWLVPGKSGKALSLYPPPAEAAP